MVTRAQVERWRALADKATPGPWYWWMSEEPPFDLGSRDNVNIGVHVERGLDAEFVCASREAVPAMADMLLRAEYLVECAGPGVTGRYEWLRDWRGEGNDAES